MILRGYQTDAIARVRSALLTAPKPRRCLLVMPAGGGKTATAASMVAGATRNGRRTLWLANRRELVDQARETITRLGGEATVTTIQSLYASGERPPADLVIVDEAHAAPADEFSRVLDAYADVVTIGLTATPERTDGRGLGHQWPRLVQAVQPSQLLAEGSLVPMEIIRPASALKPGQLAQHPVDAWREHAAGVSTIVFSPTIAAATEHLGEFRAHGVTAELVHGGTPAEARDAAVDAFRAGNVTVLVNVNCFREGFDAPICGCVVLARGAGTAGTMIQMAARGSRPYPGKTSSILIDLRGVTHDHGSPLDDRIWSLDGRAWRADSAPAGASYCKICGAISIPGVDCAECGYVSESKPIRIVNAPLERYSHLRGNTARAIDVRTKTLATLLRKHPERRAFAIFRRMTGMSPFHLLPDARRINA